MEKWEKQEVMIGITKYLLPLCSDFLPFDERDKILYNYNSTCNGEPGLSTDSDKKKIIKHSWEVSEASLNVSSDTIYFYMSWCNTL